LIGHFDFDRVGVAHDVIIGQYFAVLADQDAGAETALTVSLGGASPNRLKKSSMGSLEPPSGAMGDVDILTTTGMVFLAMAANDGRLPSRRKSLHQLSRGPQHHEQQEHFQFHAL
jgi:hypothetical protein